MFTYYEARVLYVEEGSPLAETASPGVWACPDRLEGLRGYGSSTDREFAERVPLKSALSASDGNSSMTFERILRLFRG